MEKITQDYNKIERIFENMLHSLGYTFTKLNFDDGDLNYIVNITTNGDLKKLNSINVILYLSPKNFLLHILSGNIYKFSKNENTDPFYKLVNTVNEKIGSGTFTINEQLNQILYSDSIYFGQNFSEISPNKVRILVDTYVDNLSILLKSISRMKLDNE